MAMKNTKIHEDQDRFSNLPDAIFLHILSFLDTNFSIRTCLLLSKRWVNLWTLLPNLTFDISCFSDQYRFHDFVCNVLRRKSFKIDRLSFNRVCNFEDHELLEKVTSFSLSHGVQELNLTLNHWTRTGDYLEKLMASSSLRALTLIHRVSFDRPLQLKQLTSLHLKFVVLNDSDIFSGCSSLKVLTLISCILLNDSPLPVLNVFSPNLLELTVSDCDLNGLGGQYEIVLRTPRLEVFRIKNGGYPPLIKTDQLPVLHAVKVHYIFRKGRNDIRCLNVIKMLQSFRNAESMALSMSILKLLSLSPDILANEPSPFDKLRLLTIITDMGESKSSKQPNGDQEVVMGPNQVMVVLPAISHYESIMSAPMKNYLFKNSPHAKIAIESPRLFPFGDM